MYLCIFIFFLLDVICRGTKVSKSHILDLHKEDLVELYAAQLDCG